MKKSWLRTSIYQSKRVQPSFVNPLLHIFLRCSCQSVSRYSKCTVSDKSALRNHDVLKTSNPYLSLLILIIFIRLERFCMGKFQTLKIIRPVVLKDAYTYLLETTFVLQFFKTLRGPSRASASYNEKF
jgi:hypothetical protein